MDIFFGTEKSPTSIWNAGFLDFLNPSDLIFLSAFWKSFLLCQMNSIEHQGVTNHFGGSFVDPMQPAAATLIFHVDL